MMIPPMSRQSSSAVWMLSMTSRFSFAPKCCATMTLTPLPMPIKKPVKSETNIVVEPTAPRASALENLPTTATSAMLNST